MKEFYQNLKKQREAKKMSLDDIHQATRLPIKYLKAIESGSIDKLPHGYERIYLRKYSKQIGLNSNEVIRDFDLISGKLTPPEANTAKKVAEGQKVPQQPLPQLTSVKESIEEVDLDRVNNYFWPILTAVLILSGIFVVYQYFQNEARQIPSSIKEIPVEEITRSNEPQIAPDNTLSDSANAIVTTNSTSEQNVTNNNVTNNAHQQTTREANLSLQVVALAKVWVREICDEVDTTEYILQIGGKRAIRAVEQVELTIGRADGLEIWLGEKNLGVIGNEFQVARLTINKDGILQKRLTRVKRNSVTEN